MNPDEMDDAQMMRLVTLGLAVVWTAASSSVSVAGTMRIAEQFAAYIETGKKPRE